MSSSSRPVPADQHQQTRSTSIISLEDQKQHTQNQLLTATTEDQQQEQKGQQPLSCTSMCSFIINPPGSDQQQVSNDQDSAVASVGAPAVCTVQQLHSTHPKFIISNINALAEGSSTGGISDYVQLSPYQQHKQYPGTTDDYHPKEYPHSSTNIRHSRTNSKKCTHHKTTTVFSFSCAVAMHQI